MLRTKLLLQKLEVNNSEIFLIELRFLHSAFSLKVLFYSVLYFQRYALYTAKIKKESNCVNTVKSNFHKITFNTFRDMLRTSLLLQNLEREKKLCNYL